jgi:transposase
MPKRAATLDCSKESRIQLEAMVRSRTEDPRIKERARIVLACLEGGQIQQVAREQGTSIPTVRKWRSRFALAGPLGLQDRPRSGKPAVYDAAFHDRVLGLLKEAPPAGLSQWSSRALGRALGASVHAVWRVLRREGVYLQRSRTWCVKTDPEFSAKTVDIVGLYLNPPMNALMLSIQEGQSTPDGQPNCGFVEINCGALARAMKRDYARNRSLSLLAALSIAGARAQVPSTRGRRRDNFPRFLGKLIDGLPAGHDVHVILDSSCPGAQLGVWSAKEQERIHFHFARAPSSWLSQVETWLDILACDAQSNPNVSNQNELRNALEAFVRAPNNHSKSFTWCKC